MVLPYRNISLLVTFVLLADDERGDGRADRARRVPRQGTRVRRACRTDARSLHQERATRNSAEVAAHGCSRRKACALGRLSWRHRPCPGIRGPIVWYWP